MEFIRRWVRQRRKENVSASSGWRGTAIGLSILTAALTISLIITLLVSLFRYGDPNDRLRNLSTIYSGNCDAASRSNLILHLLINAVASAILASSNFFMQVLVAPTRREIDRAHASGRWLEVGVQSIRNIPFLPRLNLLFWLLFALSSVPLHLIFNGVVTQSSAATDFLFVVAAEGFLHGAPYAVPAVAERTYKWDYLGLSETVPSDTLRDISESVSGLGSAQRWDRIDLAECAARYDKARPGVVVTSFRHGIMVLGYANGSSADKGWTITDVQRDYFNLTGFTGHNTTNSLWLLMPRTGTDGRGFGGMSGLSTNLSNTLSYNTVVDTYDVASGRMTMYSEEVHPPYVNMQAQYCLSERFDVVCRLNVENALLLAVCTMCAVKCILCIAVLTTYSRKRENPLITPGDAIKSFINKPDTYTAGMCTLSRHDPLLQRKSRPGTKFNRLPASRPWKAPTRRAGRAVPKSVWALSYILIGCSLVVGMVMFDRADGFISGRITTTQFGHAAANPAYLEKEVSLIEMTIIANTPQLILSMCYLAYNGLYTRMLGEFEWASFSTRYKSLRVTRRKGEQRTTYRLQLPYRWSVPLLTVSLLLHWLFSNSLYVGLYEGSDWKWPYNPTTRRILQYSTVSILISLIACIVVAAVPVILAWTRLPGRMVIAGGNSVIISAACHPVTTPHGTFSVSEDEDSTAQYKDITGEGVEAAEAIATRMLKWGEVSAPSVDGEQQSDGDQRPRYLTFGTEEQNVVEVVEGTWYTSPDMPG